MPRNLFALFILCIVCQSPLQARQSKPVSIYGTFITYDEPDTVQLLFAEYIISKSGIVPVPKKYTAVPRKGFFKGKAFKFEIPAVRRPSYISLIYGKKYLLHNYLILPGDSLEVIFDLNYYRTFFAGPSANAFKCQFELDLLKEVLDYNRGGTLVTNDPDKFLDRDNNREMLQRDEEEFGAFTEVLKIAPNNPDWHLTTLKVRFKNALDPYFNLLDSYKEILETERYEILKADIIGQVYAPSLYTFYNRVFSEAYSSKDSIQLKKVKDFYYENIAPIPIDHESEMARELSAKYADFLLNKIMAEAYVMDGKVPIFDLIRKYHTGRLLDKLVGKYLVDNYRYLKNAESKVKEALQFVKVPEVYAALSKYDSNQSKGSEAYEFRLQDYYGNWVTMDDLKGKIVLVDFWYTGCMPCKWFGTKTLKPVKEYFKDRDDFVVLSVSIDRDVKTWKKSVEEGEYTNEKAVNVYTMGEGDEHAMIRHYDVRSYPTVILIDRDGKISITNGLNTSPEELISILEKQLGNKPVVKRK